MHLFKAVSDFETEDKRKTKKFVFLKALSSIFQVGKGHFSFSPP
jgi:hypothetical protein